MLLASTAASEGVLSSDADRRLIKRVSRRIIPFIIVLYFIAYLDRINISFAALQMNGDLKFSSGIYGLGAGIFFVGYLIFEVPSNLILEKVGAKIWITRIMITWGLISTATAFVVGQNSFFVLRFLLGIAEAGFFPGIIVYLSNWFPKPYRARIFSSFLVAIPLSGLVGSPISGLVLDRMNGVAGLAGWQWMFIIEGLPAIVLGLACFRFLDNRPADAKWLDPSERERLQEILDLEREETKAIRHYSLTEAFSNPGVLLMCAINFTILFGLYGISFFLPQIIKGFGFSNTTTGFLSALPYLAGAGAMLIWARRSDAKAERLGHLAAAMIFAVLGFVITRCTLDMEAPALVGLLIAAAGLFAANPLLWTLPGSVPTGATAAAAVALINSVASLAGIVAPPLLGWTHDLTGSFTVVAEIFIGVLVLGVVFVGLFSRTRLASAVQR